MKQFKDFQIKKADYGFIGDKIKMSKILNKQIAVLAYKIDHSKFEDKGNKKCLTLQIQVGENKHIVFTGSNSLMQLIKQVPSENMPFSTTIIEENERYEFT